MLLYHQFIKAYWSFLEIVMSSEALRKELQKLRLSPEDLAFCRPTTITATAFPGEYEHGIKWILTFDPETKNFAAILKPVSDPTALKPFVDQRILGQGADGTVYDYENRVKKISRGIQSPSASLYPTFIRGLKEFIIFCVY